MADMEVDSGSAVIVPLNVMPLLDDTDFKAIETGLVYNSAGLVLTWNFQTTAGVMTSTAITATTSGLHDISEPLADVGMYGIEIPASGGNWANDGNAARIGTGWFTGVATGILPWRGPFVKFRAAAINNRETDGDGTGTELTAIPWNAAWDAEVQSECDDAITANTLVLDLPTTAEFNARTLAAADYVVTTDTIAGVTTATNVTTVNGLAANVITAASIATDADTEIQAACDAALVANNLDHLAKTATAAADMTAEVVDGSVISRMISNSDTSTFVPSTMSLAVLADDTEVATAVWANATGAAVYAATVTNATGADIGADSTEILTRLPDATPGAAGGVFIAGANAATSVTTALTANVIGNVTGNLSGSVGSVTGAVGSVTGAVGSVTGAVGSVGTGGIAAATFAAGAINAAAIADAAIDNATFAADVGTTAYATNNIALAADKAILNYDGPTNTEMLAAHTTTDALITTVDTVVDGIATSVAAFATTADIADAVLDEALTGHTASNGIAAWILNKLVTTDNGDQTYTSVLYEDDGTTPIATWTFTVASGTRSAAV